MRRAPRDPHDDPPPAHRRREPAPPVPTIGKLLREGMGNWVWAYCSNPGCGHRVPIALAPFAIRWGMDASSDMIRERLRCARCGRRGVTLIAPSWGNEVTGWQPFPREAPPKRV
jgi:hypothetical protein